MDVDAAGGAITGGVLAGAVEKPTGKAGEHDHGVCSDCGAQTSGNFCANCGQPTHVHRTLLHLGEELLHGVMHFDARIWRTLPLLWLNPGRLTREWIAGRRTRYVSPLAMFLFTLFVMFFALSFMPQYESRVVVADDLAEDRAALAEAEQALAQVRAEVAQQPSSVGLAATVEAERLVAQRRESLAKLEQQVSQGRADGLKPGSWQASLKDMAAGDETHDGTGQLKATAVAALADRVVRL